MRPRPNDNNVHSHHRVRDSWHFERLGSCPRENPTADPVAWANVTATNPHSGGPYYQQGAPHVADSPGRVTLPDAIGMRFHSNRTPPSSGHVPPSQQPSGARTPSTAPPGLFYLRALERGGGPRWRLARGRGVPLALSRSLSESDQSARASVGAHAHSRFFPVRSMGAREGEGYEPTWRAHAVVQSAGHTWPMLPLSVITKIYPPHPILPDAFFSLS